MDIEELRDYCLSFDFVTEESPFGPDNLVYKVHGKMFALIPLDKEIVSITLKNSPEKNLALKEEFDFIEGAYHFNKKHWISIRNADKHLKLSKDLIKESYILVWDKLPKKLKT